MAKFVPIVQESVVDFVENPARVTPLILDLVEQYDTGWVYSEGVAEFSIDQMLKLGLISNGPDDVIGNFDAPASPTSSPRPSRCSRPTTPWADLTTEDLTTNEFIDDEIGLKTPKADLDTDLASVCPDTLVVQTDWNPESEHGALYGLLGDDYEVDTNKKVVKGPLVLGGEDTGIDIEIRVGGPAIGFQDVAAQMAQDPGITMGYVATDEAIKNWNLIKTRAVVAPLEINPQIIMWDPATYPDVKRIADLRGRVTGQAGSTTTTSPGRTVPGRTTLAYTRLVPGCAWASMRGIRDPGSWPRWSGTAWRRPTPRPPPRRPGARARRRAPSASRRP